MLIIPIATAMNRYIFLYIDIKTDTSLLLFSEKALYSKYDISDPVPTSTSAIR
ncbi:hypothetical protein M086_3333, partial [Bacteroides fragilis str. S13 L11]